MNSFVCIKHFGSYDSIACEVIDYFANVAHTKYFELINDGSFVCIFLWKNKSFEPLFECFNCLWATNLFYKDNIIQTSSPMMIYFSRLA